MFNPFENIPAFMQQFQLFQQQNVKFWADDAGSIQPVENDGKSDHW